MAPRIQVTADSGELAQAAAEFFTQRAEDALRDRGRFVVALAGGSTPRAAYRLLADPEAPYRSRIAWEHVHVFFGDERFVPSDHPESNYRMANEALFTRVPLPAANIRRVRTERVTAAEAALAYERELADAFNVAAPALPVLDLLLLGLGTDGHTASLFPDTSALVEQRRWVVDNFVDKLQAHRITLTFPVLNAGRAVAFVAAGSDKAAMVARALGHQDGPSIPAARVRPAGELVWIVDQAAAARLPATGLSGD